MRKYDDGRISFGLPDKYGDNVDNNRNSRMSTLGKDGWLAEFELKHSVVMSSKKHINDQHI